MHEPMGVLSYFKITPDIYDLVISDQTMSELSGSDLLHQLLQIKPELRTIFYSGYTEVINLNKHRD
ncbi:MAG: hypothetical protein DIZ80_06590 [endosymbiont of Galathealinum brachiosum]|uniref:Response regulatory domain-containing protein n=1 Tax=endosymbiont of Galathealinum brachiosum TaxID=2200906 RepID=A0A370DFZ3_9GAMM|nr:MAG: hypothetical protein DIZ80_06590 [endosymbiont of Galathealinum brachiosum]